MSGPRDPFYARWIAANAVAEGVGLGGTLLLAHYVIGTLEAAHPDPRLLLLGALLAVALGTVLEGAVVGWAQGQVLVARTRRITLPAWTLATSLGACAAWTIGMLPSLVAHLLARGPVAADSEVSASGPPFWITLALAVAVGCVLGPILATPQWRLLRRIAPRAWRWIAANAAAWAIGMAIVFAGMHAIAWGGNVPASAAAVIATCTFAGALVGAVHGRVLDRLLHDAGLRRGA